MTERQITRFSFAFLKSRECTFIKSLLSVYKNRAKSSWALQEEISNADVIFLGTSLENDASYEDLNIQPWQFVIFYGPHEVHLDYLHLYRIGLDEFAGNILEAIEKCEHLLVGERLAQNVNTILKRQHLDAILGSTEGTGMLPGHLEMYKLVRWPSAALMQKNRKYAVLAALLIHQDMTFDEFVRRSGESLELCSDFLNQAREREDVIVSMVAEPEPRENEAGRTEKLGLFDRLRRRLGLHRRMK